MIKLNNQWKSQLITLKYMPRGQPHLKDYLIAIVSIKDLQLIKVVLITSMPTKLKINLRILYHRPVNSQADLT